MGEKIFYGVVFLLCVAIISTLVWSDENRPEEYFTELYFNEFPSSISANNTCSVSFTIISHEQKPIDYAYQISSDIYGETGNFQLLPGENKSVDLQFTPLESSANQTKFQISLEPGGEQIYFWCEVK